MLIHTFNTSKHEYRELINLLIVFLKTEDFRTKLEIYEIFQLLNLILRSDQTKSSLIRLVF